MRQPLKMSIDSGPLHLCEQLLEPLQVTFGRTGGEPMVRWFTTGGDSHERARLGNSPIPEGFWTVLSRF
jgi:hypothetical protein